MPELLPPCSMTSLTLDAIACREEDAVVVDYILKGKLPPKTWFLGDRLFDLN